MLAGWVPTHRHKKSRNPYRLICLAHDCTNQEPVRPVVVYEDSMQKKWVRSAPEFDERFEVIPGDG